MLELDYLLGANDESRLGALRFAETEGGPFLSDRPDAVPPLIALPSLIQASQHVEADDDSDEDIRLLLAPGSSLGGARPKASVRDTNGEPSIAKFPSKNDLYDVVRWEGVALALAAKAGIDVPSSRVMPIGDRSALILDRFDREGNRRVPVLSAMSLLGAEDQDTRSYLEIADAIRQYGAQVSRDLPQLWRRIVFNILISNTDDHLRNHAVMYAGTAGWQLSPAYDLNPVPIDVKPRVLSTTISIDGDPSASIDLALEAAADFAVTTAEAKTIARQVATAVSDWRSQATRFGIKGTEIDRMSTAFEHEDLEKAKH